MTKRWLAPHFIARPAIVLSSATRTARTDRPRTFSSDAENGALHRRATLLSTAVGFLQLPRIVCVELIALLARQRKWCRDRADLAKMDYAGLRDIGITSAPWSANPATCDQFARNLAWGNGKHLRALLDDCSRSREHARERATADMHLEG
jgi:uncharacterized protein YjiS (DUF1127 family)